MCVCVRPQHTQRQHTLRDTPNTNVNTETLMCTYTVYSETCTHILRLVSKYVCVFLIILVCVSINNYILIYLDTSAVCL